MTYRRFLSLLLVLLVATTTSCDHLTAKKPAVHKKRPAVSASALPSSSAGAMPVGSHPATEKNETHGLNEPTATRKFALPFAWELGENEPLAKTKGFFKEVFRDNREYMRHGPKFFEAFAKTQRPRATVVACADSRVQSAAWDNSPENDDFTIRNIGNLVATSRGSIEYGVEHLNTPVLLIVGHTGCGAVKAAMTHAEGLSKPIANEIGAIVVPKELQGDASDTAWSSAVVANVHAQVRQGLDAFAALVHEGRLTIVGAVYDFRNDLGKGAGRLSIVDVNGNSEKERLEAFVNAVSGTDVFAPNQPNDKSSAAPAPFSPSSASVESITKQLEELADEQKDAARKH